MALATTSISTVATATTSAANTTTAKVTALLNPLINAVVFEICKKGPLTPQQQNVVNDIVADPTSIPAMPQNMEAPTPALITASA